MRNLVMLAAALVVASPSARAQDPAAQKAHAELARRGIVFDEDHYWGAVMQLRADEVVLFLDAGMTPDVWRHPPQNDTPLAYVVSGGCHSVYGQGEDGARIALALIEHGADVNAQLDSNVTPFLEAADGCPLTVIRAMIDAGANVNVKAAGGASPMFYAVWKNNPELVQILLDAGYSTKNEEIPLDSMLEDKPEIRKLLAPPSPPPTAAEPEPAPPDEEEEPAEPRAGAQVGP